MNRLTELYIFEMPPKEQRTPEKARWWSIVPRAKQVPYEFARGLLLLSDVAMLAVAVIIGVTTRGASAIMVAGMEILFLGGCLLLSLTRASRRFWLVLGICLIVMGMGIILNLVFPGKWGTVQLYVLCVIALYRFPLPWSLPLAGVCILALITTDGTLRLLPVNPVPLAFNLMLAWVLCWFGWTRRTQYLLIARLRDAQEQLREQMVRNEELAAERERTRIARDIHDVLSHSLAVLSIQVQAARHLVTRDPERLAAKLDDMAALIRESIAESRHVVGLLREKPAMPGGQGDLSANLRSIATAFSERTGIHSRFEESGTPHEVNPQQRETLQLGLREMLTNAHRHGAAQTVWITLQWLEERIILEVRDDGRGTSAAHMDTFTDQMSNGVGGHHGLQGMRERAAALGGEVEAGPAETDGFTVSLRLPFEQSGERVKQS